MSARTRQRVADLQPVFKQQVKVERGAVHHLAHQRRIAHVVAAGDGILDVLFGRVGLKAELLLQLGRHIGGVGRILAAVDGAVAARGGKLFHQHDARAVLHRGIRRRQAGKAAADHDHVVALVPGLGHFKRAHDRVVVRRGVLLLLHRLSECLDIRTGLRKRVLHSRLDAV